MSLRQAQGKLNIEHRISNEDLDPRLRGDDPSTSCDYDAAGRKEE